MKFRLKAFGIHLTASATALALALAALYFGWYRWPGWYVTGALKVVAILIGVDAALGPSLTLLIANPAKPRRELARDIAIIVAVQLVAFGYGVTTLWQGRPLYYTFSFDRLEAVQASAILPEEAERGRRENPTFAPHWYSLPKWVWAPLPEDRDEASRIAATAIFEGQDVIDMPRYFRPWAEGLPALRASLKRIDELPVFTKREQQALKARLAAEGLASDSANVLYMSGRDVRLIAVVDLKTLEIRSIVAPPASR